MMKRIKNGTNNHVRKSTSVFHFFSSNVLKKQDDRIIMGPIHPFVENAAAVAKAPKMRLINFCLSIYNINCHVPKAIAPVRGASIRASIIDKIKDCAVASTSAAILAVVLSERYLVNL